MPAQATDAICIAISKQSKTNLSTGGSGGYAFPCKKNPTGSFDRLTLRLCGSGTGRPLPEGSLQSPLRSGKRPAQFSNAGPGGLSCQLVHVGRIKAGYLRHVSLQAVSLCCFASGSEKVAGMDWRIRGRFAFSTERSKQQTRGRLWQTLHPVLLALMSTSDQSGEGGFHFQRDIIQLSGIPLMQNFTGKAAPQSGKNLQHLRPCGPGRKALGGVAALQQPQDFVVLLRDLRRYGRRGTHGKSGGSSGQQLH